MDLKMLLLFLPTELRKNVWSYVDLPTRLGLTARFVYRLKRCIHYPRHENGMVSRPIPYFSMRHKRSPFREYASNKYFFRRCRFRFAYKLTSLHIANRTHTWLEIYPNFKQSDSWLCSLLLFSSFQKLGTVNQNPFYTTVYWDEATPTGYYDATEYSDPKGLAQIMNDALRYIHQFEQECVAMKRLDQK